MAWAASGELTSSQVEQYLRRLGLAPAEILSRDCDLALLTTLQSTHLRAVPFDTSLNHISDNAPDDSRITLHGGPRISCELQKAFHNLVTRRRGGYCFSINVVYAALLRALGFKANETCARVFQASNADPEVVGFESWGVMGHRCILVDLEDGRYLTDFGSFLPLRPTKLVDGEVVTGNNDHESFRLTKTAIPGQKIRDPTEQWMLWRRFKPYGEHWSPIYHITVLSVAEPDWAVLNFWHSNAPEAPFVKLLLVTSVMHDSADRRILSYSRDDAEEGKTKARYYVRSCVTGKTYDECEVDMTKGALLSFLQEKFGFLP